LYAVFTASRVTVEVHVGIEATAGFVAVTVGLVVVVVEAVEIAVSVESNFPVYVGFFTLILVALAKGFLPCSVL
jgi:hypothetical protein